MARHNISDKKQLIMIDGSSFLYRAFHALRPLHTKEGLPVHAVYGFCRMLKKIIDTFTPDYLLIAWDSRGPTKRHAYFPEYKAKRLVVPNDLMAQKEQILQFVHDVGIMQIAEVGYEADDLLATMAQEYKGLVDRIVIVTSDKDLAQLVNDSVVLYDAFTEEIINDAGVEKKFGIMPAQLPLYFALLGDASDNIPGVSGIGKKSALQLAQKYNSLDALYEQIETVTPDRIRMRLKDDEGAARLSAQLFKLDFWPGSVSLETCQFAPEQWLRARSFFVACGFTSLLKGMAAGTSPRLFADRYQITLRLIQTEQDLIELCAYIRQAGACAIDTETTSLRPMEAALIGISFCCESKSAWYLPVAHTSGDIQLARDVIMRHLEPLLHDAFIRYYFHNALYDLLVLRQYGFESLQSSFDTMVAASLVSKEGERVGLKFLSQRYFNQEMVSYKELMNSGKYTNFAEVPVAPAADYAAADAHQTWQLVPLLQELLVDEAQKSLYETIEAPLIPILCDMEYEGIILNVTELKEIGVYVDFALGESEREICEATGKVCGQINLNAPRQIEKLLFEDLKLTPLKKTASGGYSTAHDVLVELARQHPVPSMLLVHRALSKIKNTYIDALPTFINPATGRIHTSFSQVATATGRLASSDPNMQTIPVDRYGGYSIRSAFKAPTGYQFIVADYSQIELRILAHLSQDENLKQAFLTGEDIHTKTSAELFQVAIVDVTHEQRRLGKRINFSILYGLTPYSLARELQISMKEAKEYIEKYFATYPQVAVWMESVIASTKEHGYAQTYFGRRRYLAGIYEKNKSLYELARRVAINTVVQGTAAEIMKLGMIHLDQKFKEEELDAQMILQIHDELLITAAQSQTHAILAATTHVLEKVVTWDVPLRVNVRNGPDWGTVV